MKTQSDLLDELAWRRRPRQEILDALESFGSSPEDDLYTLPRAAVVEIIDRRLADELSEAELIDWARYFECREEVGYEESARDIISSALYWLSNPEHNQPLTRDTLLDIRTATAAA